MDRSRRGKLQDFEDAGYPDKTQVLQEAKEYFMATSVKTKRLADVLTKCMFIILQGEQLVTQEATDLFFHITRLFQYKNKDSTLRRLIYIGIKALSQQAENVHVVTSSLTTDVNSPRDDPAIRASALRALCQISDASTLISIERNLKQSVVDRHPVVASAAISSLVRIAQVNTDIVRRCANEIQEALNSDSPMVQYHALGLQYNSCKHDQLAVSRLIKYCLLLNLKSEFAVCALIRIITSYINDNKEPDEFVPQLKDYIRENLTNTSDMIVYEAANAIINLKGAPRERKLAVSRLEKFLSSPKAVLRFSSVRILNELNASSTNGEYRFWSTHRIGRVCKLHLLNKYYRLGEHVVGIVDFSNSDVTCAKYTVILQCEETGQYELKQEFSIGLKKNDFAITLPPSQTSNNSPKITSDYCVDNNFQSSQSQVLHCVLSFLFHIVDKNYSKTLFQDRAGTIELGPNELNTKLFSCDFPIAIHAG